MKNKTFVPTKGLWGFAFVLGSAAIGMLVCQSAAAQGREGTATRQCNLAIVSRLGGTRGPTCDEKAIREMARHGHVYEQNQLGIASILAIAADYSTEEALKWFERAAQQGYAPAQVNLAVMYSNGWGTATNYGKALHWFQMAIDQDYPRAYYNLGILYLQGKGVRQDYAEAARLFSKGAERGDTASQSNLGYMYDRGLGVAEDAATAAAWYRKAADGGNLMGQNNLADMYLRGAGVPQDDKVAFRLFQQASGQGHTGARIKLGYLYAEGRGTGRDPEAAYTWITAASMAGDQRGQDILQSLQRRLTPGQIAKARDRARELLSSVEPAISAKMLLP